MDQDVVLSSDRLVQRYLRASIQQGRDTVRAGPFLASFSPPSRNPYLNYAIPDDGAEPTSGDVAALIEAYETRDLRPRLEYLTSCSPRVEAPLVAAGFTVEGRLALMLADARGADAPVPSGFELVRPATTDELRGLRQVQHEAYDDPEPLDAAAIERLRRNLEGGAGAVLARAIADREPAGAGEFTPPIEGVSEITSIAVREPYRRRGIAAAMTSWLLREAREVGASTPFLMANEAEERIYARVGFTTTSRILHISR